jgi:hypothetical protein
LSPDDEPTRGDDVEEVRRARDAAIEELAVVRTQGSRRRDRFAEELEAAEKRASESARKLQDVRGDLDRIRRRRIFRIGKVIDGAARRVRSLITGGRGSAGARPAPAPRVDAKVAPHAEHARLRSAPSVAIHIGARTWTAAEKWGDTAFARSLQHEFELRGWSASVHVADESTVTPAVEADVALHLFGSRVPAVRAGQVSLLWVISHPDRVTERLCASYDVAFVASESLREVFAEATATPVVSLLQATDPGRFHPDPTGPKHELLFVGNSRGVRRPILDALAGTGHDLAVYGSGWTPKLLDMRSLRGEWIPNDQLNRYYSSADIVLSDHWRDMREEGFISNRVFDALASGAFVISDDVAGLDELFDGAVVAWHGDEDLEGLVGHYLARPEERRMKADQGRAAVLARHTFAHRVDTILETIAPLLATRIEMPASQPE